MVCLNSTHFQPMAHQGYNFRATIQAALAGKAADRAESPATQNLPDRVQMEGQSTESCR